MNVSLRHTVSVTDAFAVKTKHESISLSAHITTQTTHITHTGRPSVDPEHVAIFPQLKCITLLCFVYSRCVLYRRLKPTIILRSPADLFIWVRCRVSWIKSPQRFASLPLLPLHRVSHGANGHTGARVSPLQSPSFVHDLLQSHPCCPPPHLHCKCQRILIWLRVTATPPMVVAFVLLQSRQWADLRTCYRRYQYFISESKCSTEFISWTIPKLPAGSPFCCSDEHAASF